MECLVKIQNFKFLSNFIPIIVFGYHMNYLRINMNLHKTSSNNIEKIGSNYKYKNENDLSTFLLTSMK